MPFARGSPLRLNLNYTLLPELLQRLDYDTFAVGKWHLGQNEVAALPTSRGFSSHYGYWTGAEDHYNHQSPQTNGSYDFADDLKTCVAANGTYGNDLFVERATKIIEARANQTRPFFLYLAFQNVHWPLQAPDSYVQKFAKTTGGDRRRQYVAAMASAIDDGVGAVVGAVKKGGLIDSSLIIFVSDNGGPTNGNEGTWSSNFPLRGGKNTLWEGGTRVAAVASGVGVGKALAGGATDAIFHVVDWMPTLVHLASGSSTWLAQAVPAWRKDGADVHHQSSGLTVARADGHAGGDARRRRDEPLWLPGDGVDQLALFTSGTPSRDDMVLEAHPESAWSSDASWPPGYLLPEADNATSANGAGEDDGVAAVTVHGDALITSGGWKLVRLGKVHPKQEAGWVPPPGQDASKVTYTAGCDLSQQPATPPFGQCEGPGWCLFNVTRDPCEYHDLSSAHPDVVADLRKRLAKYQATAVPPLKPDGSCAPIVVHDAWRPCDAP